MSLFRRPEPPRRQRWDEMSQYQRDSLILASISFNPAIRHMGRSLEAAGIATPEQAEAFVQALGEQAARMGH